MKFYSTIKHINLPRTAVESAWNFAKKVVSTIDYSDSNQLQLNKIRDDHFVSKLGEEACKIILSEFAEVKGPDYNIYDASQKSWSDDLYINHMGFAVKTQRRTNAMKYSLSWTFQSGEKRKDIILNRPEAWVVFVEYDDTHPYTCYVYPPMQIKELIFDEPKLERLRGHKKVVYASTLKFVE